MSEEDSFTGESFEAVIEGAFFEREAGREADAPEVVLEAAPECVQDTVLDIVPEAEAAQEEVFAFSGVGLELRTAREARDLTAGDVAKTLKLSVSQVEALEADDWRHFPGNTVIRGFVRNYARLLELEPSALMRKLDALHVCESHELNIPENMNVYVSSDKTFRFYDYLYIFTGGAILLLSVLAYFLLPDALWQSTLASLRSFMSSEKQSDAPDMESRKTLTLSTTVISDVNEQKSSASKAEKADAIQADPAQKALDTENGKTMPVLPTPAALPPTMVSPASTTPAVPPSAETRAPLPVSPMPSAVSPSVSATGPGSPESVVPARVLSTEASQVTASPSNTAVREMNAPTLAPGGATLSSEGVSRLEQGMNGSNGTPMSSSDTSGNGLLFRFLEGAWVEVRDHNNRVVFSQMNSGNTQHKLEIRPPFSLVVGNASHVRVYYNGKAVDLSSSRSATNVARVTVQKGSR